MPVERNTPQLVKKGKGKKRPGYAGWNPGAGSPGTTKSGGNKNTGSIGRERGADRNRNQRTTKSRTPTTGPTNIHTDNPNAPAPYTFIGGKKYNVTPETKAERNRAELKQQLTRQPVGGNRIDKFGNTKKSLVNRGAGGINGLIRLLMNMAIPGSGFLTGGFDKLKDGLGSLNETLGDFREKTTGFRTQQEWEDARTQRQLQGRLDDMYAAKSKGKGFSQKNIDMIEAMGFSPSTAQNVLTGRDLKGFTESRGLQIPISNEVVDTPNAQMGTPWDNPYEAPMGTPWDNPYKAPDSPEWTSWEVPPGMMNDAYQDNLEFFDNLNKGIVENNNTYQLGDNILDSLVNSSQVGNQNVNRLEGSVLDATPKKGIMESISDWFSSSQQPETIVENAAEIVPTTIEDITRDGGMLNSPFMETQIQPRIIAAENAYYNQGKMPSPFLADKIRMNMELGNARGFMGPGFANGGLASLFTRRG